MRFISRFYWSRAQGVSGKNEQTTRTPWRTGLPEARGPMQLHRLHRLMAGPDVENWLYLRLLRIMRGTKRLNPFFRLHEASEVFSFSPGQGRNQLVFSGGQNDVTCCCTIQIHTFVKISGCNCPIAPLWLRSWPRPKSLSCCFLWVRYGVKTRLAYTVAKAADIQWSKMLAVRNAVRVKLGCSLTSIVL